MPHNPYTGLWSRLEGFRPGRSRSCSSAGRSCASSSCAGRSTSSPPTTACCCGRSCSPCSRPSCGATRSTAPPLREVDLAPSSTFARAVLAEQPRSGTELRALFAERFPDLDPAALAHACQMQLAFVQVPPRGLWGRSAQVRSTTAESWLGRPLVADPSIDSVVLRYFAAFGPASVADVATWCRADRDARGGRAATATARHIPRRARPRAVRPPRGPAARPRRRPPRCASSPSTTTSCSRTTTAADSSIPPTAPRSRRAGRSLGLRALRRHRRWRLAPGAGCAGRPPRRPAAEEGARLRLPRRADGWRGSSRPSNPTCVSSCSSSNLESPAPRRVSARAPRSEANVRASGISIPFASAYVKAAAKQSPAP